MSDRDLFIAAGRILVRLLVVVGVLVVVPAVIAVAILAVFDDLGAGTAAGLGWLPSAILAAFDISRRAGGRLAPAGTWVFAEMVGPRRAAARHRRVAAIVAVTTTAVVLAVWALANREPGLAIVLVDVAILAAGLAVANHRAEQPGELEQPGGPARSGGPEPGPARERGARSARRPDRFDALLCFTAPDPAGGDLEVVERDEHLGVFGTTEAAVAECRIALAAADPTAAVHAVVTRLDGGELHIVEVVERS